MVESETTCVVEGINGLVWFNTALGGVWGTISFSLLFSSPF